MYCFDCSVFGLAGSTIAVEVTVFVVELVIVVARGAGETTWCRAWCFSAGSCLTSAEWASSALLLDLGEYGLPSCSARHLVTWGRGWFAQWWTEIEEGQVSWNLEDDKNCLSISLFPFYLFISFLILSLSFSNFNLCSIHPSLMARNPLFWMKSSSNLLEPETASCNTTGVYGASEKSQNCATNINVSRNGFASAYMLSVVIELASIHSVVSAKNMKPRPDYGWSIITIIITIPAGCTSWPSPPLSFGPSAPRRCRAIHLDARGCGGAE